MPVPIIATIAAPPASSPGASPFARAEENPAAGAAVSRNMGVDPPPTPGLPVYSGGRGVVASSMAACGSPRRKLMEAASPERAQRVTAERAQRSGAPAQPVDGRARAGSPTHKSRRRDLLSFAAPRSSAHPVVQTSRRRDALNLGSIRGFGAVR